MQITCRAVLFDLDGTLVDSSAAIERSWLAFCDKYQLNINELLPLVQGKPTSEAIAVLRPSATAHDIQRDTQWIEDMEAIDIAGIKAIAGAHELLVQLERWHIPWAIVTSGTLAVATARISAAGFPEPKVLVTPESVQRGKPDPQPYHLGAEQLGIDIAQCLVFEDAPAGVISGVRAGAKVLGLLTQFDRQVLVSQGASGCIETFNDLRAQPKLESLSLQISL